MPYLGFCPNRFDDFHDGVTINSCSGRFPKEEDHVVFLRRTEFPRRVERVLGTIVQAHRKRSKWFAFRDFFDIGNFHAIKCMPDNTATGMEIQFPTLTGNLSTSLKKAGPIASNTPTTSPPTSGTPSPPPSPATTNPSKSSIPQAQIVRSVSTGSSSCHRAFPLLVPELRYLGTHLHGQLHCAVGDKEPPRIRL